MRSLIVLVCIVLAASNAQQNYDGRNGPHEFGQPGNRIYIRGQNEEPYQVPGVGGTFQNSPSGGHVYTDEQGNTYSHHSSSTKAVSLAPSTVNLSMGGVLLVLISLIAL